MEENASLFTSDTSTPYNLNITEDTPDLEINSKCKSNSKTLSGIHSQSKHKYRNIFGDSNIQYHETLIILMYSISKTNMLHYYNRNCKIPTGVYMIPLQQKIIRSQQKWTLRQCPMQCIFQEILRHSPKLIMSHTRQYHMMTKVCFRLKLMDEAQVQIFIDNGAMPSILPLSTYNKYPLLRMYLKTESNTPIHTGGSMIEPFFDRDTFETRQSDDSIQSTSL